MRNFSRRVIRLLLTIGIPLACAALGGVAGVAVRSGMQELGMALAWVHWEPPPDRVVELLAVQFGCLAVRTAGGQVYQACDQNGEPDVEWQVQEEPFSWDPAECRDEDLPDPPRDPIALVEDCSGTEAASISRFALDRDGSIWSYQIRFPSPYTQIGQSLGAAAIGGFLGLAVGSILVALILERIRPSEQP